MKKEEFKPLRQVEQGLTTCKVHNQFTGMVDACCVRSAVMGFNKEYCYCHDLFNDGVIGNEIPYCTVCADIRKWFPVFFEDVDVSGVQE